MKKEDDEGWFNIIPTNNKEKFGFNNESVRKSKKKENNRNINDGGKRKMENNKRPVSLKWLIGGIILGFVCISIIFGAFFVVNAGERGLVFSAFGGMRNVVYSEGIHMKLPFFDNAIMMNIKTQKHEEEAAAASLDLQDVSTTVAVNYIVKQDDLVKTYRNIGQSTGKMDYMQTQIMNPIILESVKAVTARYSAEDLIHKRPEVKDKIDTEIMKRLEPYGITVLDVSITNFKFSETFSKAIEDKVTAEQNALKEENNLKVVQFQAQQKVETAKGDTEAMRIVNEQLEKSPKYIDYLTIQKWNGIMPLAMGSGSLLSIGQTNTIK